MFTFEQIHIDSVFGCQNALTAGGLRTRFHFGVRVSIINMLLACVEHSASPATIHGATSTIAKQ